MIKICIVCLSKGRILYNIDEYRDIYEAIVTADHQVCGLSLCFECISVLRKCRRFQKNAAVAHERLKLLCSNSPAADCSVGTCSKLGISSTKHVDISPNTDTKVNYTTSDISMQTTKDVKTEEDSYIDPLCQNVHTVDKDEKRKSTPSVQQKKVKLIRLPSDVCKKLKLISAARLPANIKIAGDLLKKVAVVPKQRNDSAVSETTNSVSKVISSNSVGISKIKTRSMKRAATEKTNESFKKTVSKVKVKPKNLGVSSVQTELSDDDRVSQSYNEQEIRRKFTKMLQNSGINEENLSLIKVHVMSDEDVAANRELLRKEDQFQKSEYKCMKCVIGYYNKQQLEDHTKTKHVKRDPDSIPCPFCATFVPGDQYLFHYGRHKVLYECLPCAEYLDNPRHLPRHFSMRHAGGFQCGHCLRKFALEVNLRRHIARRLCRGDADKKYMCDICQKGFRFKYNLRKHVMSHSQAKSEHCVVCNKWYKTAETLAAHVKYVHERDTSRVYRCEECDVTFANHLSYEFHMTKTMRHADVNTFKNICEICGKGFVKYRELENHMNYRHRGVTEFVCPHCSKMFSSASGLKKHVKFVHEGHRHEKNRECGVCGKRFTNSKTAKEHMNIHTGSRPFKCSTCGDTFRQSSALYTHNRLVHLGYKVKSRRTKV